jgi:hypothetical protein
MRSCAHHPDRTGHALCMACRKVLCQECATEWDGINYCAACLVQVRAAVTGPSPVPGFLVLAAAVILLFLASARLMVFVGVLAAELL